MQCKVLDTCMTWCVLCDLRSSGWDWEPTQATTQEGWVQPEPTSEPPRVVAGVGSRTQLHVFYDMIVTTSRDMSAVSAYRRARGRHTGGGQNMTGESLMCTSLCHMFADPGVKTWHARYRDARGCLQPKPTLGKCDILYGTQLTTPRRTAGKEEHIQRGANGSKLISHQEHKARRACR